MVDLQMQRIHFMLEILRNLKTPYRILVAPLQNHKTSKQNEDVIKRLNVILKSGDYESAKVES